jgi:hypothetical protein
MKTPEKKEASRDSSQCYVLKVKTCPRCLRYIMRTVVSGVMKELEWHEIKEGRRIRPHSPQTWKGLTSLRVIQKTITRLY